MRASEHDTVADHHTMHVYAAVSQAALQQHHTIRRTHSLLHVHQRPKRHRTQQAITRQERVCTSPLQIYQRRRRC
jgi:hypothetical protein